MPPDAAEQWLRDNDPDYAESRKAWKDIEGVAYERPWQELLWDDPDGEPDEGLPAEDRLCELCLTLFRPTTPWNRYCSERHRATAEKRRQRMRVRGIPT